MPYQLNVTFHDPSSGLHTEERLVPSRDIKALRDLPATTVSFTFPIADGRPTGIYYIGQPLSKDAYLHRTLSDRSTAQDVICAERQIDALFIQTAYTALAVTSADDRIVHLTRDDRVLNNVTDRKTVWKNVKTPPRPAAL